MTTISCDFSRPSGAVKPLHGVNNAPVYSYFGYDRLHYFTEAGIPFCRFHDFGGAFGCAHLVDVENLFPNMSADENDPASYDFTLTDRLIEAITAAGVEPFYRLGATIENGHYLKAYHIYPPQDYEKYARVCCNIVRHYNEGWANGYHFNIRYWEIWNEPDNSDRIEENPCWKGTKEQFFEFYRVLSTRLRAEFPSIKIGGYASSGFYAVMEREGMDKVVKAAHVSPRYKSFLTFYTDFLDYVLAHNCPLDFFSWHTYGDIHTAKYHAAFAREELDRRGLQRVESILNEWNPGHRRHGTPDHAADIAQMMIGLHPLVDQMEFYTGSFSTYGALFDYYSGEPTPAYYVFPAYNALYRLGRAVPAETGDERVLAMGATNGEKRALLIASAADTPLEVNVPGFSARASVRCVDGAHTLTPLENAREGGKLMLPPYSVILMEE